MLISIEEENIINYRNYELIHFEEIDIYYSGSLFFSGKREGRESLGYLADCYKKGNIPFRKIYGCYAIVLYNRKERELLFFSDNSNMHGIWISDKYIGSNIVEIGKIQDKCIINKIALCEYLTFHRFYLTESMISGVNAANSKSYYLIRGGILKEIDKEIGDITDASDIRDPKAFFKDVAYAFDGKKVVCGLTGGYDSRLVTAMYNYYSHTDCFISGDNPEGADIIKSKEVARRGGIKHIHIVPDQPECNGNELVQRLFEYGQYKTLINTHGYRRIFFMNELKKKYDILLSGNAGDMHKYFWDTRKMPVYPALHKANMKKLVDKFFIDSKMKKYLGDKLIDVNKKLEADTYKIFDSLKEKSTIKSYLRGGWYDWISAKLLYTESVNPKVYVPLQEFELVKYSYGISPKGKIMNSFHRKLTTYYNPNMAKADTIYWTSACNHIKYYIRDFPRLYLYWINIVVKYMQRKIFHAKSYVNQEVIKMDLSNIIRESDICKDALRWAKKKEYINKDILDKEFPNEFVEKVIYVYLLDKEIKKDINQ